MDAKQFEESKFSPCTFFHLAHLHSALDCLGIAKKGFPNYFGLQRFGTSQIRTHEVGKLLLQKNWKEAYCAVLRQECKEERVNNAKRKFLEDFNFELALKSVGPKYVIFLP
jgi:tRNA pseudouridine13 synthase